MNARESWQLHSQPQIIPALVGEWWRLVCFQAQGKGNRFSFVSNFICSGALRLSICGFCRDSSAQASETSSHSNDSVSAMRTTLAWLGSRSAREFSIYAMASQSVSKCIGIFADCTASEVSAL